MKIFSFLILVVFALHSCAQEGTTNSMENQKIDTTKEYNILTNQEKYVILNKGTDRPFTGEMYENKAKGTYVCTQCNNPLYQSDDKFDSHCGWPSFDDEIKGSVVRVSDADGMRVEIVCANCKGHLGHVFEGEGFTEKDTRHCVNTSSIKFYPSNKTSEIPGVIKK